MRIQLSDHFTYRKLLRFVLPSIVMMIFTSIYGVIDGLFISNFAGKTPFAAINLIWPVIMILGALGFMVGTGGSAIVAKTLGEGKKEKANEYFSLLVYTTIIAGIILTIGGMLAMRPISIALGAEGAMLEDCVLYGRIVISTLAFFILQNVFQSFFVTAEKPQLGLIVTIAAGVANIVLDFVLVTQLPWKLAAAAVATAVSQLVGGALPLIYFAKKNNSLLRLTKTHFDGQVLLKTCINGSSELLSSISMSLVNILYNFQLMRLIGEDGVAAYGVIMYINFVFVAIFIGYSIGSAPLIGYNYGAENYNELKNLFKKSLKLIGIFGITMVGLGFILAYPLTYIFFSSNPELIEFTCHAFRLFVLSFLLSGFNIFGSSFFTALNNGLISAIISFLRTLVFQVGAVLIFPLFLDVDGIWLSVVFAELMALIITFGFLIAKRKKYQYA